MEHDTFWIIQAVILTYICYKSSETKKALLIQLSIVAAMFIGWHALTDTWTLSSTEGHAKIHHMIFD
jgi:hypothetical protein